jgi:hypothetical protein
VPIVKLGTQDSESESSERIDMPTPPQHRIDQQTGRDARGRLPLTRSMPTPIHSMDRPNPPPITPIHSMDRPNTPPITPPKRRRTCTPPSSDEDISFT